MGFVAKQFLKSKTLFHIYNFDIILFTTPSDMHYFVSQNSSDSGKNAWSYSIFLELHPQKHSEFWSSTQQYY